MPGQLRYAHALWRVDVLALALALAAPYFTFIPTRKLRALPLSVRLAYRYALHLSLIVQALQTLATALTATIISTFKAKDDSFLSGIPSSISKNLDTPIEIKVCG